MTDDRLSEDWHGWKRSDTNWTLHIGPLPIRKRIALCLTEGTVTTPLAYFRTEDDARRALAALDRLIQANEETK